ncbi:MAG TPA: hypothetical protein VMU85_05765 [Stellaceae bacterium]|nr:hypothetical protein [Stellaceae bacterium]
MSRAVFLVPMALAIFGLAACAGQSDEYPGSAGYRPYYERGIDQDINATHNPNAPTAGSEGLPDPSTELDQPTE